jgi:ABC-type sulfate transport system permease component
MGAFGTAFTLASQYEVVPITIYNEFTNYANFALAASLSIALGLVTVGGAVRGARARRRRTHGLTRRFGHAPRPPLRPRCSSS